MLKLSLLTLVLTGFAFPSAARHLTLVDSSPKEGATVATAPTEIVLKFNERLDPARRAISLRGPAGAVTMGPVRSVADTMAFAASITGTVTPGEYTVSWLAASPGHASLRGRYTFSVKAAP